MNRYCFIIPIYNHPQKLEELIDALEQYNFPIILIDDGSDHECKKTILALLNSNNHLILHTHEINQGKGAAVMKGLNEANKLSFSHGIQIDADFQHDVDDVQKFVHQADAHPKALICGIPIYDESVPKSRFYSRYLTHVWVWINTLSTEIKDSMCGYRVYPLDSSIKLINDVNISTRMNFDTDIIVRLKWRNTKIINVSTKVVYHDDVPSNFRLFKDNVGISITHGKLFFGMLVRLPMLLKRKIYG